MKEQEDNEITGEAIGAFGWTSTPKTEEEIYEIAKNQGYKVKSYSVLRDSDGFYLWELEFGEPINK